MGAGASTGSAGAVLASNGAPKDGESSWTSKGQAARAKLRTGLLMSTARLGDVEQDMRRVAPEELDTVRQAVFGGGRLYACCRPVRRIYATRMSIIAFSIMAIYAVTGGGLSRRARAGAKPPSFMGLSRLGRKVSASHAPRCATCQRRIRAHTRMSEIAACAWT